MRASGSGMVFIMSFLGVLFMVAVEKWLGVICLTSWCDMRIRDNVGGDSDCRGGRGGVSGFGEMAAYGVDLLFRDTGQLVASSRASLFISFVLYFSISVFCFQ